MSMFILSAKLSMLGTLVFHTTELVLQSQFLPRSIVFSDFGSIPTGTRLGPFQFSASWSRWCGRRSDFLQPLFYQPDLLPSNVRNNNARCPDFLGLRPHRSVNNSRQAGWRLGANGT